jgi:hypothetical protein
MKLHDTRTENNTTEKEFLCFMLYDQFSTVDLYPQ